MNDTWRVGCGLGWTLVVLGGCTADSAGGKQESPTTEPSSVTESRVDAATPNGSPVDASRPPIDAGRETGAPESGGSDDGCPTLVARGSSPLLSDFETNPSGIAAVEGRRGTWIYYDDGSNGEQHNQVVEDGSAVLHVSSSGWSIWGSGLGTTLSPSSTFDRLCPYDASPYSGLSFRARGQGRVRLRLGMPVNTPVSEGGECTKEGDACYDWPGIWFHLTNDWQTHVVPFCALRPEGWSGNAPELDPTQLGSIHFLLEGEVDFWLDDLTFTQDDADSAAGSCVAICPLEAVARDARIVPDETWAELTEQLTLHVFEQETTSCGPVTRRYLSYVPGTLEHPSDAPVLIALHGSGANAESFRELMTLRRFEELAERDGFIVVYGNAAPGAHTDPQVDNSGSWRQDFYDDGQVDDIDYLLQVVDDLEQRGLTRSNNDIYLTGLSNGGGMVLHAATRAQQHFAGIAALMPFAGWEPDAEPQLDGSGLKRVLIGYAPDDPGMPAGYGEVLRSLPARWGRALGIPDELLASPAERQLDDLVMEGEGYMGTSSAALSTQNSRVVQRDVVHADAGVHLRELIFEGAGHFWPTPDPADEPWVVERWGFRNQDLDASDAVWDFLQRR